MGSAFKGSKDHHTREGTAMLKQLFYSGPSMGLLHAEYAKKGR
jgi:hypothetical protein